MPRRVQNVSILMKKGIRFGPPAGEPALIIYESLFLFLHAWTWFDGPVNLACSSNRLQDILV